MRRQTDLPSLNARHSEFLSTITIALFLHKSGKMVYESLRKCLSTARCTLKCIEEFVFHLEHVELNLKFDIEEKQICHYKEFLMQRYQEFLVSILNLSLEFIKKKYVKGKKLSMLCFALKFF